MAKSTNKRKGRQIAVVLGDAEAKALARMAARTGLPKSGVVRFALVLADHLTSQPKSSVRTGPSGSVIVEAAS